MIFFTADEHYGHTNIIKYCNRPFKNVYQMDDVLIQRHNEKVHKNDIVYHLGDFCLKKNVHVLEYVYKLKGTHIFLKGSHDRWLKESHAKILTINKKGTQITLCHYSMRTWPRSHYNTWHLYGHSHGKLPGIGKSMDVGVDTNNFYPYSLDEIEKIMNSKPDNQNKVNGK